MSARPGAAPPFCALTCASTIVSASAAAAAPLPEYRTKSRRFILILLCTRSLPQVRANSQSQRPTPNLQLPKRLYLCARAPSSLSRFTVGTLVLGVGGWEFGN